MGVEDDVLKLGKKLEKLVSSETSESSSALDLLKALRDTKMSLEVLQRTRIGMTVNNLRKASKDEEVITLAKTLIKNWKKLLPAESPGGGAPRTTKSSSGEGKDKTDEAEDGKAGSDEGEKRPPSNTGDSVRIKCRELLCTALKVSEVPEGSHDPEELSCQIEDAIFEEFKNTEMKYKNRIRSRVANLKDSRNPQLRQNVLNGLISAERMACLTPEEMASKEMTNLRSKLTKQSIDDHQMVITGGTPTDLFKCGKCRKKNCTYNQVQTRSADEPMTTFVYCNECGNRWKFC